MKSTTKPIGFIGLGSMGMPMALNLLKGGVPLLVWNRSIEKTKDIGASGAQIADSIDEVFAQAEIVILMLSDSLAIESVLDRGGSRFAARVRERIVVHMGTTAPDWSQTLEADIIAAGGRYVEAPVSGSRKPAEAGQLVAMLAGESGAVEQVRSVIAPMCRDTVACGAVPNALLMKLAVNVFLISMVTGLAESVHFAARHGLDLSQLMSILNAGQMASDISRVKTPKLVARDFSVQASITNVFDNARLVAEAARKASIASPLLDVCRALYEETLSLGHSDADMAAVLTAIEARSDVLSMLPDAWE